MGTPSMPIFTMFTGTWPKRHSMMIWLVIALLLCYIDRILISLAAIEMQNEFGWSDSDKGLVLSSFFMGYLIMQLLGGILANRYGGRNVFLIAVLLWSLFTILTPLAASISFGTLILVRFMLGFGEGAAYPAGYSLIHEWMPRKERSVSISLISAAGAVGTVSALLVTGKLIELYGWQAVFYFFGSLGFVWSVFWLIKIPSSAEPHNDPLSLRKKEKRERKAIPWKLCLTHPAVLTLYLVTAVGSSISYTMASWLPSYFVDTFALTTTQAGLYSILPWLVVAIVAVIAGRYADKLIAQNMAPRKVRVRITLTGFTLLFVSLIAITFAPSAIGAVLLICCLFAAMGILIPGYSPIPAELLPEHGEILYGFMASAGSISSVFLVYLAGLLLDETGSYDALFYSFAAMALLAAVVFFFFAQATPIYTTKMATDISSVQ